MQSSVVVAELKKKMDKCEEHLHMQFSGLRTGRASPALVENVMVPYYGSPTPLRQIASISVPEPRLIVINAYDPNALRDIEKAISAANLGVTPMSDGRVVRLPIPELSEERRNEIVKLAKRMAEESRVTVRNHRREANEEVKKLEKEHKIGEDERDKIVKEVQKITDDHIKKIDQVAEAKSKEISQV